MNKKVNGVSSFLFCFLFVFFCKTAAAESYRYNFGSERSGENTVLGFEQYHVVKPNETLLDIARDYGLGYNEITILYPELDPWVPGKDRNLVIPTRWILPSTKTEEVVINIPEMRLYRFMKKIGMVKTYPIGIGREGFETPVGNFHVIVQEENPTWSVPPSAREAYNGKSIIPPGPENPLGDFWIGLSAEHIGIHGTNFPWAVGRRTSRGCIRLYPEHISIFYEEVKVGTKIEIIYEPVKIGVTENVIYVEVHPDIYNIIPDMMKHTEDLIYKKGIADQIDWDTVYQCVAAKKGIPVPIGLNRKGGDV